MLDKIHLRNRLQEACFRDDYVVFHGAFVVPNSAKMCVALSGPEERVHAVVRKVLQGYLSPLVTSAMAFGLRGSNETRDSMDNAEDTFNEVLEVILGYQCLFKRRDTLLIYWTAMEPKC